jgi:hypothetical protein
LYQQAEQGARSAGRSGLVRAAEKAALVEKAITRLWLALNHGASNFFAAFLPNALIIYRVSKKF